MYLGLPNLGVNGGNSPFGPASLFAGGAPGVWFDPSDFTSLYQDSAGTTPVTAFEQPVGLLLDKSQGAALGVELSTVNFTSSTGWSFGAVGTGTAGSITGGALAVSSADASDYGFGGFSVPVTVGKSYLVTFTTGAGVTVQVRAGGSNNNASAGAATAAANSTGRLVFTATASPQWISFNGSSAVGTGTVTTVSVKTLAGNHASQATTTQRPVVSARYNLLTKSDALDDTGAWVRTALSNVVPNVFGTLDKLVEDTTAASEHKVTQNVVLVSGTTYRIRIRAKAGERSTFSFYGSGGLTTGTSVFIDLGAGTVSGGTNASIQAVGDGSYIVATDATSSFTGTNALHIRIGSGTYTGDGVSGLYLGEADLRASADAALSIPAYQQVTSSTVYAAAGFPAYLKFDGVDDGLATGNIDFTGTSKMTVFAGVTKLSDAAAGAIVELSAIANTTPGSFVLLAPGGALPTTGQYVHGATGLNTISSTPNDKAAPASYVHTGLFDLSQASPAAQNVERLNGVAYASPNADAGGGNFSLNPLYIGRRFNTSTALNGRLYGLIAVGAGEPANTITFTERWMGQKEGIGGL